MAASSVIASVASVVTGTVAASASAAPTGATRAAEQSIFDGVNPIIYSPSVPVHTLIVQVRQALPHNPYAFLLLRVCNRG